MKKGRELFDAQVEEIHKELVQAGVGGPVRPGRPVSTGHSGDDLLQAEQPSSPAASTELTTSAFQLAGYVVATLALGRSIPGMIVLKADAEYDVGRCSEADLDTIWAVGNLAAERGRGDGCPWEPGPSIVIFKMERDAAMPDPREAEAGPLVGAQRAEAILDENWDDIAHVAGLLSERRRLSRAEIEAEIFEQDDTNEVF
ncbi:MAG: hypothetical protein QOI40_3443 [Alphaproteobacteria bacterium]|nr:hypothetical protein [Alphaproteobacteria bacterium]